MKKWTTPMAMEECFTANVDVAVTTCYKIACNTNAANNVEYKTYGKIHPFHLSKTCGGANHQTIQVDTSNENEVIKMMTVSGGIISGLDSDCILL